MSTIPAEAWSHAADLIDPPEVPSEWLGQHWQAWLPQMLPSYFEAPFAEHHADLWEWVWSMRAGVRPQPFIACWNRGGTKSTSAEAASVAVGAARVRRYGLYCCGTQDQADDHVANVGNMLESRSIGFHYPELASRAVNKFGSSRGWRRNRLRTAAGFTLDAIGLDTAARGVKLDEQRPDWLVVDDIDSELDSPATVEKKITILTRRLIPAGSRDLAVLGAQNLVHENSVFAQLVDGRADFLTDRHVSGPVPALRDFAVRRDAKGVPLTDEAGRVQITGTPTWAGMGLERCAEIIADVGLIAFAVEYQHDVGAVAPGMFDPALWRSAPDAPWDTTWLRRWDMAATEAKPGVDPDWTAGVLMGRSPDGRIFVADARRMRGADHDLERFIAATAHEDLARRGTRVINVEREPGSAGKNLGGHYTRNVLPEFAVNFLPSTGNKTVRAKPWAGAQGAGNVFLLPDNPHRPWHAEFIEEHRQFPRPGVHDDWVDAASLGYLDLASASMAQRGEYRRTALTGRR